MPQPSLRRRALRASASAIVLSGCLVLAAAPAWAQTSAAEEVHPDDEAYEVDELVVTSSRQQTGAVIGDIPPEIQLGPRDIRAYGVSSISELVEALAPQTASGRGSGGRPVILVNGQRISSFAEIRDMPTEAIQRVDILPEEVALKYGYRADQRVMNIVLRNRFRAVTAEGAIKTPTQGNGEVYDVKANALRIQQKSRTMIDAKASKTTSVLESQRGITGGRSDGGFRSLVPDSESVSLNAVVSRPFRETISASLNGSLEGSRNDSLLGLPMGGNLTPTSPFTLTEPRGLERSSESVAAHAGAALNGAVSGWSWSLTGNADLNDTKSTTERVVSNIAYTDKSSSVSKSADGEFVINGALAQLPAGAVSTSLKAGASTLRFDTRSLRAGVARSGDLGRDTGSLQANLDVPLANRAKGVMEGFGDLTGNVNFAVDRLSDFGNLTTVGGGLNWSPVKPLRVIASFTRQDGAPSIQQLGNPEQVTPDVQVFDFVRGETVEVTRIEGGNPNLDADNRTVMKLGMTLKPFEKTDITFTANYVRTEIRDVIAAFPTATSQIEAAFPNRFVRDATGRLVQIDSRPVNFDRRDTQELRWGFTYRKPLTPARPIGGGAPRPTQQGQATPEAAPPGAQPPPGGDGPPPGVEAPGRPGFGGPGGGRGFGGRGFGGGRAGGGNIQVGLFHTLRLEDQILIRPGVPALDLLDGAAIGNSGGQPRHQVDLQANASKNGYGVSANARWQSATRVDGSAVTGLGDLKFDDLTTVNVRFFADLGARPEARRQSPWLRGARISLSVDNLFDSRQQVRAANGLTPVNFQPDYLDPLGRTVRLSFRKLFF